MQSRTLGKNGPTVPAVGLGCNPLVTFDAYGSGVNESLIARAIIGKRDYALLATQFGNVGFGGGVPEGLSGGHPKFVKQACDKSLKRLGVDVIMSGTPAGVDPVKAGDRLEGHVEGVCELTITYAK